MTQQVEFGCLIMPDRRATSLRSMARMAADVGFDRFWVPDQEFFPDPFVILADLAERTEMELGLAVASPFARHPVQIARAMASVIQVSDPARRWVLGLGKGNSNLVLRPLGRESNAGTQRLADSVSLVKALLRGEAVGAGAGGFVTSDVCLQLDPVRCEVFVGARGPRTLQLAGRAADGVLGEALFKPSLVPWVRSLIQGGEREEPKPFVAWQAVVVLDEGEPIPQHIQRFAAMLMRTTSPPVLEMLGISTASRRALEAGSLEPEFIPGEDVRRFVAVGTPSELRELVGKAVAAGVSGWTSVFVGDRSNIEAQARVFAEQVMSPIRAMLRDGVDLGGRAIKRPITSTTTERDHVDHAD